jgi:hypothetical protein
LRLKAPLVNVLSGFSSTTPSFSKTKSQNVNHDQWDVNESDHEIDDNQTKKVKPKFTTVPSTSTFEEPIIPTGFVQDLDDIRNNDNDDDQSDPITTINANFNIEDLTDEERKCLLLEIIDAITNKSDSVNKVSENVKKISDVSRQKNKSSRRTKLKHDISDSDSTASESAPKVKIVSSIEELSETPHDPQNPPIFVILLPENRNKK